MFNKIIQALKRPNTGNSIINEVEGLRFIAIIGVVLAHAGTQISRANKAILTDNDWLFNATQSGGHGVNLFFSISGFILAYPFAKHYLENQPIFSTKAFYVKRLTRLEPPFIINILLLFIMQIVLMKVPFAELLPHLAATLTYSHCIVYGSWSSINPVTWSLETEVQFYLLAPLLFGILYSIKIRKTRVMLIVAALILMNIFHVYSFAYLPKWHLDKSILSTFDNFLAGILFIELFLWPGFAGIKKNIAWDILFITSLTVFFYLSFRLPLFISGVVISTCLFGMFVGAFKGILFNYLLRKPIITVIGGMCYTIYLYHYAMLFALAGITKKLQVHSNKFWVNYLVQVPILILVVLIICGILFYLFEKPFMKRNWYKRKTFPSINKA